MANIIDFKTVIRDAVAKAAEDPHVSLETKDASAVAKDISPRIESHVQREVKSVLKNATNQEPWYQSRVIIGLMVTLFCQLAGAVWPALGLTDTDATDITEWVFQIASAFGALYAWYGRTIASQSKPLGE